MASANVRIAMLVLGRSRLVLAPDTGERGLYFLLEAGD